MKEPRESSRCLLRGLTSAPAAAGVIAIMGVTHVSGAAPGGGAPAAGGATGLGETICCCCSVACGVTLTFNAAAAGVLKAMSAAD